MLSIPTPIKKKENRDFLPPCYLMPHEASQEKVLFHDTFEDKLFFFNF